MSFSAKLNLDYFPYGLDAQPGRASQLAKHFAGNLGRHVIKLFDPNVAREIGQNVEDSHRLRVETFRSLCMHWENPNKDRAFTSKQPLAFPLLSDNLAVIVGKTKVQVRSLFL